MSADPEANSIGGILAKWQSPEQKFSKLMGFLMRTDYADTALCGASVCKAVREDEDLWRGIALFRKEWKPRTQLTFTREENTVPRHLRKDRREFLLNVEFMKPSNPIENSIGGRWYGPDETCNRYLRTLNYCRFIQYNPPVRPVMHEEIIAYGRDYPVLLALLAKWDCQKRGPYGQFSEEGRPLEILYLMDLDLHTLPPLPVDLMRVSFCRMPNLLKIPRKVIEALDFLEIRDCPLLEDIGDIPEKKWNHLQIPGFIVGSYLPQSKIADANEVSHKWKKQAWCRENKERIIAKMNALRAEPKTSPLI